MADKIIDHIPLIWEEPKGRSNGNLIIWLPGLGGSKDGLREHLQYFAKAGFTALSFDPREHGERMLESREEFGRKLGENKRRYFWPMIAHTAEEYPRVIDWALAEFALPGTVMAGGVSMGGDIAVVAAGIDKRIRAVAACISTPDWMRPGSDEAPSEPDAYALNCYKRCNPMTNLELYTHAPAIRFLNGREDGHVPPDGARRFREATQRMYAVFPERMEITEYDEVGHRMTDRMLEDALDWFRIHADPIQRA